MKLSAALEMPMEQLVTLTVEKKQQPNGKPADTSYLEKYLPASIDKALREYVQGEKDKVSYLDWTACGENCTARSTPTSGAAPSRRNRQTICAKNICGSCDARA